MDIQRHPRHRQRRPQRLRRHQGHVQDRRRRVEEGHRGARRAVAEALGGLRRHHQPDERHRRSRLATERRSGSRAIERRHHRRHRRRARRAGDEPLSHRAVDRSRRPRARRGRELLAARALGLAAAADAELAEPPARLSLRRRRSRRLHDDGRGDRVHLALRRGRRARRCARTPTVTSVSADRRRLPRRDHQRRHSLPDASCSPAAPAMSPACRRCAHAVPPSIAVVHAARLPQSVAAARRRRAGRRRVGDRRAARRRDPPLGPAASRCRSASTCGCRGPIAAATCCGGWTRRASGTSATTRSTI